MAHPPTLATFAQWLAGRYGATPALRFKRDGVWQDISYEELSRWVPETARKLRDQGVNPGDRVALMADTCPEWTICDLAIAAAGAVCVPVYPTNSASECAWVLGDSGARLAVCGSEEQRSRVGDVPTAMLATLTAPEGGCAGGNHGTATEVDPGAVNTIIYTSGTTGPPKGCLITHANWWQTLEAI
ncbi:MAG: AMP-binding protein, partial [Dehalococcoidia bacterium]